MWRWMRHGCFGTLIYFTIPPKRCRSLGSKTGFCWKNKAFGFSPLAILNEAARSLHYSAEELDRFDFSGIPPDLVALSLQWKEMLKPAHHMIDFLPAEHVGQCLLEADGRLFSGDLKKLENMLSQGENRWHRGTIGGVLPQIPSE